ncbi:ABC-type transport system involved in multi-copper enzyme maturation, permease component [Mucilaginibacter lappiensis]|uniref:ABC-type transport system involved in multi-copper enzyme maturation, permease component n=1 Tax=Mucilaginibacter lappiensis TaxID=354630 RepID=A0ABR6PGI8_9SPHI|nr:hypothetical protein [Mucilaginibacter lappiensis]MBB6107341.1 hypothetical protein [Mucilaginibacter lappiensis]SIQ11693.1 ABC-type transport system involved in multi-copper enzyme maturation, permease component [Mucilaginibacter lappiensis]
MFWKIFIFEVQNRLRRPAVYLYFAAVFVFVTFTFSTGSLPVGEKEHINSPMLIAMSMAWISTIMMLVTSAIMGMPLYKDIEYNTKDYYLTYPITKAGYFWGRYCSSILFVFIIGSGIMLGVFAGSKLGPLMGWREAARYGPNHLEYYVKPFLLIAIPNLVFTSSIFYGLVALTRNIKVIYSSGIVMFLGYMIASFSLMHLSNEFITNLADPFAFSGIRSQLLAANDQVRNVTMISFEGSLLINRILWPALGLLVLIITYLKFNFEDFFSGKRDKRIINSDENINRNAQRPQVVTSFADSYNRQTLVTLVKTELVNIVRDNYFWIIIGCGLSFLGFVFYLGDSFYGIPNFPRTVALLKIFYEVFLFFIFFIIIFYTGETVHRDRITRYAYINDSLPAPNWVLNGSRLISLLIMGLCLSLVPLVMGIFIQIIRGYHEFAFSVYLIVVFTLILPRFLEMVVFAYVIHVIFNNKFAAHGIGIVIWIALFFLHITSIFNYNILLYSYTPDYTVSDMDGIGHMAWPVFWFNFYWLLAAGILIIIASLFYYRGLSSTLKERLQLIPERFDRKTKLITTIVLFGFLGTGSFLYYNVNYLNNYLTRSESDQRAVAYEQKLKPYANLPLPKVTAIKLWVDLYPEKQQARTHGYFTLVNQSDKTISQLLLDGDRMSSYSLKTNGKAIPYTTPLLYARGKFNWFRAEKDTADFRLYHFAKVLAPGDSMIVELRSAVFHKGFTNSLFSGDIIHNGTFFRGGIPGLGYDEDDELHSPYERKRSGLAPKKEEEIAQNDPEGIQTLSMGKAASFYSLDITVSTSGDQTAITNGYLEKQWKQNGRNYFQYVQNKPGMYPPFGILSARYAVSHHLAVIDPHHHINVDVFYHPDHKANVSRYADALKAGLTYYSGAYGIYPFHDIRLVESSVYSRGSTSSTSLITYNENGGWNADFKSRNNQNVLYDYCYYESVQALAQQWWMFQVCPNNTVGSHIISDGLPQYDAFVMIENKYGKENMRGILREQLWGYLFWHSRGVFGEKPLIRTDAWYEWDKAGVVLYGLRDLIGDEHINAALRDFKNEYAFKKQPPYAGSNDLYRYLKKYTPDSLQYYLTDTWEKITFYNNRVIEAKSVPLGHNKYRVTFKVSTGKIYINTKGDDIPATMNDYIDIGVFAKESQDKDGQMGSKPLYLKKYKLTSGEHTFSIDVQGIPESVGIDPYNKLVDRAPMDNNKKF